MLLVAALCGALRFLQVFLSDTFIVISKHFITRFTVSRIIIFIKIINLNTIKSIVLPSNSSFRT